MDTDADDSIMVGASFLQNIRVILYYLLLKKIRI